MLRSALLATLLFATAACSRSEPPRPDPPPAKAASAAPSPGISAPAPRRAAPTIGDTYQGRLDPDLAIFMRLSRDPATDSLRGSYFYAAKGLDIALTGPVSPDGSFTLDELSNGKKTGTFTGALAPDGKLSGTWADPMGKTTRHFVLTPIPRDAAAPAVIAKKQYHARYRVKDYTGTEPPYQIVDLASPELFGLADAAVEAKINERLAKERREPAGVERIVETYKSDYTVTLNRNGLLSLRFDDDDVCFQCAHPSAGGKTMILSLATGEEIPLGRLFVKGYKPRLEAIAGDAYRKKSGADFDEYVLSQCLEGDYVLHDKAIELIAYFRLPHAFQASDPQLVIPYASIEKLLDPKSPAAAAWRGP